MKNKIHGLKYFMFGSFYIGMLVTLFTKDIWLKYDKNYKRIK